jgi:hypothetical protein
VTAEGVTIHRYGGGVSVVLGPFEDVASIVPLDDSGVPVASVESDGEPVERPRRTRWRDIATGPNRSVSSAAPRDPGPDPDRFGS